MKRPLRQQDVNAYDPSTVGSKQRSYVRTYVVYSNVFLWSGLCDSSQAREELRTAYPQTHNKVYATQKHDLRIDRCFAACLPAHPSGIAWVAKALDVRIIFTITRSVRAFCSPAPAASPVKATLAITITRSEALKNDRHVKRIGAKRNWQLVPFEGS